MTQPFWKERPLPPIDDWRAWSLGIPSVLLAMGFVCFAFLGYSFREFAHLADSVRVVLVLVGAALVAIGGELGTCSSTIEIFRKRERACWWDWAALIVSAVTTLCAFGVAASYLPQMVGIGWIERVRVYGPAVLMLVSVGDGYFTFAEFGLYLGSYDERVEIWTRSYERFARGEYFRDKEDASEPPQVERLPAQLVCPVCGATSGRNGPFSTQRQLAGHMNAHKRKHREEN